MHDVTSLRRSPKKPRATQRNPDLKNQRKKKKEEEEEEEEEEKKKK